jgi:hypothetical protein
LRHDNRNLLPLNRKNIAVIWGLDGFAIERHRAQEWL